jgi:hypothetical protein
MADLSPDLSGFAKPPQPMTLPQMLYTLRSMQDYQFQQEQMTGARSMSQAIRENPDPMGGTDWAGVSRQIHTMPGLITPEREQAITQAAEAGQRQRSAQAAEITKLIQPLADLKANPTLDDIDHLKVQATAILGPSAAAVIDKIFHFDHAPTSAEIRDRVTGFGAAYGALPSLTTVPTQAGPMQVPTTAAVAAARRGGLPATAPEYEAPFRAAQIESGNYAQDVNPLHQMIPILSRM